MAKMVLNIAVHDENDHIIWKNDAFSISEMWNMVKAFFMNFPQNRVVVTDHFHPEDVIKDLHLEATKTGKTRMIDADPKAHELTKERIQQIISRTHKELEAKRFNDWISGGVRKAMN